MGGTKRGSSLLEVKGRRCGICSSMPTDAREGELQSLSLPCVGMLPHVEQHPQWIAREVTLLLPMLHISRKQIIGMSIVNDDS